MDAYDARAFPTSKHSCPHMEGKGAPVCWDCAEAGHIYSPSPMEGEEMSPSWEKFKRFQESPIFRDGDFARNNIYSAGVQSLGLELRPAEDGLEVGVPNSRRSQPGLEVVTGPQVVSPQDKFRKPELEHQKWNSPIIYHQQQEEAVVSHPSPQKQEPDSYNYQHQEDRAILTREPIAGEDKKENEEKKEEQKILGLRRRTFWIVLAIVVLALFGLMTGVAVGLTQQNKAQYVPSDDHKPHGESELITSPPSPSFTPSSTSDGGQVNGGSSADHPSTSPTMTTKAAPTHVTSDSSSPTVLSDTNNIHPSSHQGDDATSTPRTAAATGGGGGGGGGGNRDPEFVTVTATPTIVDDSQRPSTAILVQPTTVIVNAPSPPPPSPAPPPPPPQKTSPAAQAFPAPYSSRICFRDDGSTYTDPGTGSRFSVECGVAHEGKDIENLEAETMEQCVNLCAKNKFCKGAIWFNVGPQGTDLNYCWLKSEMDGDVRQTIDAQSVVRL